MLALKKSYRQGEIIYSEIPLAYALFNWASTQFCADCLTSAETHHLLNCSKCKFVFYCGKSCQKSHWHIHKKECSYIARCKNTPDALMRVIHYIVASKIYQNDPEFATLISRADKILNVKDKTEISESYSLFKLFSNNEISISREEFLRIFSVIQYNLIDIADSCGYYIGCGIYKKHGEFKHSCCLNVIGTFVGKEMRMVASEDIPDASEIRRTYTNVLRPTAIRQKDLQKWYHFNCDCSRCSNEEEDRRVRIPPCCRKLLRKKTATPSDCASAADLSLDLEFSKLSISSENFLICDQCHSVYNTDIFDEIARRFYNVSSYMDALQHYKLCARSSKDGPMHKYYRLIYEHEENLSFFWICRTVVVGYRICIKQDLDYEELDLVVEAGLRTNRCLTTSPAYQTLRSYLQSCLSRHFLMILLISIGKLEDSLALSRSPEDILHRIQRYKEAFAAVARTALPLCEKMNSDNDRSLFALKWFANELNLNI